MNRRRLLALLAAIPFALPVAARALSEPTGPQPALPQEKLVIVTRDGVHHDFSVEMAPTPEQQITGLMFRPSVPADGGMLFDWGGGRASRRCGCRTRRRAWTCCSSTPTAPSATIAEHTVPQSLAVIDSRGPVRATLELAAGTAERLDIRVGDKVLAPDIRQRCTEDLAGKGRLHGAGRAHRVPPDRGVAQPGSARVLGTRGRRFESGRPDHEKTGGGMPARARIYQQPKTAMQSGRAGTHEWVLDFEPAPQQADPLMGWIGGGDTLAQVQLRFDDPGGGGGLRRARGHRLRSRAPADARISCRKPTPTISASPGELDALTWRPTEAPLAQLDRATAF